MIALVELSVNRHNHKGWSKACIYTILLFYGIFGHVILIVFNLNLICYFNGF